MGVREKAIAAFNLSEEKRAQALARDQEARQYEFNRRNALETIEISPLSKWFPDEDWKIVALASLGVPGEGEANGRDCVVTPESDQCALLLLERVKGPELETVGESKLPGDTVNVYAVEPVYDDRSKAFAYDGRQVYSVAEVGEYIVQRDRRATQPRAMSPEPGDRRE